MDQKERVEEFRQYFNKLEKLIKERNGEKDGGDYSFEAFSRSLRTFIFKFPRFSFLKEDLKLINDIRNVIVHDEIDECIVIPSDHMSQKIKSIYGTLSNPPKWDKIGVREIYSCNEDDSIVTVVKEMARNTYTHVPVLKDGIFQWLLAESVYVQWLSNTMAGDGIISSETQIKDLKKYTAQINDEFAFLPRDTDIFKIRDLFEKYTKEKFDNSFKRLGVIFITQTGKKTEKILGLITAWDLAKINNL